MVLKEHQRKLIIGLNNLLSPESDFHDQLIQQSQRHNPWFTPEMTALAIKSIRQHYLAPQLVEHWLRPYPPAQHKRNLAIICAGNIPLVGFHDILCAYFTNHNCQIKLSSKDDYLMKSIVEQMQNLDDDWRQRSCVIDQVKKPDMVIATGSNNTQRYFEQYFQGIPNILRNNRTSVAVLDGKESNYEYAALSQDIFSYYGLGCRNVAHLFLPRGFDLLKLRTSFEEFNHLLDHHKYRNNYDYNYAIYLMNKVSFYNLGPALLLESHDLFARIACIHYQFYDDVEDVVGYIKTRKRDIQCVVSSMDEQELNAIPLGMAQSPSLNDYSDGMDTIKFLLKDEEI